MPPVTCCRRAAPLPWKRPRASSSPAVEQLGDVNMSDPDTLANFVAWGMKNYPAEHFVLIISDHGGGWKGAVQDESKNGWSTTPMLDEGLAKAEQMTGRKLDVLGFDACLMASGEVVHQLGKHADYMICSQQTEGADGWQYTKLLNPSLLNNIRAAQMMKINVDPRQLAIMGVTSAATNQQALPTMTAFETAKIPAFTTAVDELGKAIIATSTPNATLKQLMSASQNFYGFKDAVDFADRLEASKQVQDPALKEAAKAVRAAVKDMVIAEQHSPRYPGAHGVHLEMSTTGIPGGYGDLAFAKDSSWAKALDKISK